MLETKDERVVNYYKQSLKEIEAVKASRHKPKLLLHACCGPCACHPLEVLNDVFDITIYYANSNIFPKSEYERRRDELVNKVVGYFKDVKVVVPPYDNVAYNRLLAPYAKEKECGKRCWLCYELRLRDTFDYAKANGYDYVCTVLTISRMKDSQVINQIAALVAKDYPDIHYFYSDFKKDNGITKGNAIARHLGLYRQDYCGCIYSWNERNHRIQAKENK